MERLIEITRETFFDIANRERKREHVKNASIRYAKQLIILLNSGPPVLEELQLTSTQRTLIGYMGKLDTFNPYDAFKTFSTRYSRRGSTITTVLDTSEEQIDGELIRGFVDIEYPMRQRRPTTIRVMGLRDNHDVGSLIFHFVPAHTDATTFITERFEPYAIRKTGADIKMTTVRDGDLVMMRAQIRNAGYVTIDYHKIGQIDDMLVYGHNSIEGTDYKQSDAVKKALS